MALIEIKHRFTGAVLFALETESLKLCLQAAVKSRAYLYGAYLRGADLSGADLYGADLSGADLSGANLYGANLSGANLSGANLRGADLYGANLSGANLYGANLSGANLRGANLRGANLYGADLRGAYLRGADLSGANLSGAQNSELAIAVTRILPDGDLIGWKQCANGVIVKLRIPADAKRSSAFGRKCRAEYVIDLGHWDAKGEALPVEHEAYTDAHGPKTIYHCGETIKPDSFDENWMEECSHGVHFYVTRLEAEQQ